MTREMFGALSNPSSVIGTQRRYTVPLSILTHAAVLAVALIVPVLASDLVPNPASVLAFIAVPPASPPPEPSQVADARPAVAVRPEAAPIEAPSVVVLDPAPAPPRAYSLAQGARVPGGIPGSAVGSSPVELAAPPAVPDAPIRPGGDVAPPEKIKDVRPVYPPLAVAAGVSGVVIIEAIITREGTVRDPKVLRSVPLLDQAALDAVRQWRYTPTRLNGVPVEVVITVTVNFTLR